MGKVKKLYDAIVGADAWYIAGSPLLDSIAGVGDVLDDPENEVFHFTWEDEDGSYSESVTEDDLARATVVGNTITILDPDGDWTIQLYRLAPIEIDLTSGQESCSAAYWFTQICETAGIRLVKAQKEEIAGRWWDWLDDNGNACDMSFSTEEEAAEDAVKTLFPIEDWRYDVQNGDTKLSYTEWVDHNAESLGTQPAKVQSSELN